MVDIIPQSGLKPVQALDFTPLPKQKAFSYAVLEYPKCKFAWYCGGFGSGKSYVGAQIANRLVAQAPYGRGLIARQTQVDLKATTMKTFWEVTDPRSIAKHNKSESLITFKNGHEVYYWGLDDIEKLKSLEIGWFWIDEVNEINDNTFNVLKGRLRHKAQPKRVGYITSNSEGKNWTYNQFIKGKGIAKESDLANYYTFKAPSNENTNLPEDYLDVLNSYTGDLYKRYVNADFNVFEGQIFPDFNPAVHVITPFAIPDDWERRRVLDHGERNPSAMLWWAISPQGDVFFYREYYKAGESVKYHAEQVWELERGEKISYMLHDPSIKSTRGQTGKKIDKEWKYEMKKHYELFKMKPAKNDVSAGISRVHRYLQLDMSREHFITRKKGAPRVYFFSTMKESIEEIEKYKWKKISTTSEDDAPEAPRKKDDHAMDCIRYALMDMPDITNGGVSTKKPLQDKLVVSKRDQVLSYDEQYLEQLKKQGAYADDFIL